MSKLCAKQSVDCVDDESGLVLLMGWLDGARGPPLRYEMPRREGVREKGAELRLDDDACALVEALRVTSTGSKRR